ncbi:MAG: hypothetical protein QG671_1917 [Actinomycetota bacterium]|nr:hypothetical protein [Actinomycetota bacterium]
MPVSYTPEQAKALAAVAERQERSARISRMPYARSANHPAVSVRASHARFNRIGLSADIPELRDNPARAAQFDS